MVQEWQGKGESGELKASQQSGRMQKGQVEDRSGKIRAERAESLIWNASGEDDGRDCGYIAKA